MVSLIALSRAAMKDSDICVGWMPFSKSDLHALRRAPAMTHTDVVPSPASISTERYAASNHRQEECAYECSLAGKEKSGLEGRRHERRFKHTARAIVVLILHNSKVVLKILPWD